MSLDKKQNRIKSKLTKHSTAVRILTLPIRLLKTLVSITTCSCISLRGDCLCFYCKILPSPKNLTSQENFPVSTQIFDRNGTNCMRSSLTKTAFLYLLMLYQRIWLMPPLQSRIRIGFITTLALTSLVFCGQW